MALLGRRGHRLGVPLDRGHGPVVILVHGIASSSVPTFDTVIRRLVDNRVIAVDLLGFGLSPAPTTSTFTVEDHVRALSATVDSLDLDEPFTLVGHSMGGLIVTRYASLHPDRIAGLVLVSLPVYLRPSDVGAPADKLLMRLYHWIFTGLRRHRSATLAQASVLSKLSPVPDALDLTGESWNAFALSLARTIEHQTVISDLVAVTVPVTVIVGDLDPLMARPGLRIIARMRGITVHHVALGDHLIRGGMVAPVLAAIARTATTGRVGRATPA